MSARILLAGLFHETHTFLDEVTGADAVRVRRGAELLARRGDGSTIDGFFSVAERNSWQVVPTVEASAMPSGAIDHAVFEAFWGEVEAMARAAAGSLDGIWLSLHGAMVTTASDDPEGEFLMRLRTQPGFRDLPLFGVFDLHATFTPAMARHADGLVAYRENPHADAHSTAAFSAELLARALATGRRPRMRTRTLPIVWPPTGTGTADSPVRELEAAARRIEATDPAIWAVNIVPGYAFADTAETGLSVSVITEGGDGDAERHLDALSAIAERYREAGVPREWALDAAIDDALAKRLAGPVLLVEPADNIGGGAPGDCTSILRAFLARGLDRCAVVLADAGAVKALDGTPVGARVTLDVVGKGSALDPGSVRIEADLVGRTDGRFTLEDRQSHLAASQGVNIDMGPSVTLRAGGVSIVLTTRKMPPFDLGQLRSQGVVPEEMRFIGVKAAVGHRRAYDPIAAASYTVATPGPCPSDLTRLPYRRIRRPVFPLDPPWRP